MESGAAQIEEHSGRVNVFALAGRAVAYQAYLFDNIRHNYCSLLRVEHVPSNLFAEFSARKNTEEAATGAIPADHAAFFPRTKLFPIHTGSAP